MAGSLYLMPCLSVFIRGYTSAMSDNGWTRREFLHTTLAAGVATTLPQQSTTAPWYRRAYRWGQTNITEKDPQQYDIDWWRGYWKRTAVQAVIINAGGIVAYYPS